MHNFFSIVAILVIAFHFTCHAEISSGRIKGDDEPHMVSWRVLEGVTEPFESNLQESIPPWKLMKNAADQKAAGQAIQQALHEYGQLLRHPYMFGDMPMEERYDVFLSMSKLLKTMGFHQRAELLLYEAMSYTTNPHEAHLQLGILFLDKEDLEKAKIHLKNCLFFKENDVLILIHLSVILIAEGRTHEAKFFLSRILAGLEARVHTLSFVMSESDINALTTNRVDYKVLSTWVEDLIVKVLYGEFRFTPSSTMDMLKLFSNLYRSVTDGELTGRFIFDLGQSLYEGGRPRIGQMMMKRGFETSDEQVEGAVSTAIVDMRLALDYPVVPASVLEILEAYLNMTGFLSNTSASFEPIDLENVIDLYWPLPLLAWSALPVMPVLQELMWRFQGGPVRTDIQSAYWLKENSYDATIELYHPMREVLDARVFHREHQLQKKKKKGRTGNNERSSGVDRENFVFSFDALKSRQEYQQQQPEKKGGVRTVVIPPTSTSAWTAASVQPIKIEVGIFGGHMNNHPVGQMVFRRLLGLNMPPKGEDSRGTDWRELINLTLLALPLVPDFMTKRIASSVSRIVNLPMDTAQAWRILQDLHLDVIVFPDWQPFPDQQSILFQTRRMAPVQVCMFVRGSSCASVAIDYYLMPEELEETYLQSTPASDINARFAVNTTVLVPSSSGKGMNSGGGKQKVPQEGSFVPPPVPSNADYGNSPSSRVAAGVGGGMGSGDSSRQVKTVMKPLRPLWKEFFSEQVVLLDWPLLTPSVVQSIAQTVTTDEASATNRRTQSSQQGSSAGDKSTAGSYNSKINNNNNYNINNINSNQRGMDDSAQTLLFSPMEIEGRLFFENQPVAVLPVFPTYVSPLMDELIFKIMRSVPSLHVVLALPDSFFTHARDLKHKVSWARKLVRRLWTRGGNLFHRIRLLPSPLSDQRLMQLMRQADMVLDSFPFGSSFYYLSLALAVGTPVITLRSGTLMHSSKDELKEMRTFLTLLRQKQRLGNVTLKNPMAHHVSQGDLPFFPSVSSLNGFYHKVGLAEHFIANSTSEYFQLASALATDREYAYSLRVKLLEAVDGQSKNNLPTLQRIDPATTDNKPSASTAPSAASTGRSVSTMEDWEEEEEVQYHDQHEDEEAGVDKGEAEGVSDQFRVIMDCGHCVDDLGRFFLSVGVPYARSRSWRQQSLQQHTGVGRGSSGGSAGSGTGKRGQVRNSAEVEFYGTGTIL